MRLPSPAMVAWVVVSCVVLLLGVWYGRGPLDGATPSVAATQPHEQHHEDHNHDGDERDDGFDADDLCLWWMAPFLSGGGYCSEATEFALALDRHMECLRIWQHGDGISKSYVGGLSDAQRQHLKDLMRRPHVRMEDCVLVCHSEPGAWGKPTWSMAPDQRCPPPQQGTPRYVVGRTMFETDRIPDGWPARIAHNVDEVWVPTQFHVDIFQAAGVPRDRIFKLGESIDVDFWDPGRVTEPLDLLDFDPPVAEKARGDEVDTRANGDGEEEDGKVFRFLSVFKWEKRKGWRTLLRAYFRAFQPSQAGNTRVSLLILTRSFHNDAKTIERDIAQTVADLVGAGEIPHPRDHGLAHFALLPMDVPSESMPALYAAVDAFVLPTHGEGWGRPVVEAMSMSLPVLTTLWSGPTEYLRDGINGYGIRVEQLEEVGDGPFADHKWAVPSEDHLISLMQHVVSHPEEAAALGRQAREDMVRLYHPDVLAGHVMDHLRRIERKLGRGSESA